MWTRSRLLIFLLVVALLSGCSNKGGTAASSGASGGPKVSSAIPNLPGKLLETGQSTLDLFSGGRHATVERAANNYSYFEYPIFAPDGSKFAYVLATVPTTAQTQDWGNDIYMANADGSNTKLVLQHDHPGAQIDSLSWSPDGASLIYDYELTQYDAQDHYTGFIQRIERLSLDDGTRTTLLKNAIQPSLSWDGKEILYVETSPDGTEAVSLAIASIDGSQPHQLLTNQRGFQGFFAPHLSPDGKQVAFAAIGGPLGSTPGASSRVSLPSFWSDKNVFDKLAGWLSAPSALADGTPYQVWVANIDGTGLHTLGNLREDLPFPLWSSDGKMILFLGASGLYLSNTDGSNLKSIGNGVPHGQIAWYQGQP